MTKASDSNTLRGAVLALAAALVAGVVGLLVQLDVIDAATAAVITGLVAPILGAVGAIWSAVGRYNPEIQPIERSKSGPSVLLVLALLAVWLALPACGTTFECRKTYERHLKPAAPFSDDARCDGDEVFRASGPINAVFRVSCPPGRAPWIDGSGVVGCREVEP